MTYWPLVPIFAGIMCMACNISEMGRVALLASLVAALGLWFATHLPAPLDTKATVGYVFGFTTIIFFAHTGLAPFVVAIAMMFVVLRVKFISLSAMLNHIRHEFDAAFSAVDLE